MSISSFSQIQKVPAAVNAKEHKVFPLGRRAVHIWPPAPFQDGSILPHGCIKSEGLRQEKIHKLQFLFCSGNAASTSHFLWYSTFPLCYTETRQTIPQTATVGQKRRSGSPPERRFVMVPESEASGLVVAPLPIRRHCEWPGLWNRFPGPVPTESCPRPDTELRTVCWDPVPAPGRFGFQ